MSAMLYTHTAEPRKMELEEEDEAYVNEPTDRSYDSGMSTWTDLEVVKTA